MMEDERHDTFWKAMTRQFSRHWLGMTAFVILILFLLVGIYAPLIASSKPLIVHYDGVWYFPLFRYLFYRGFFTSRLDLFFNLLMFTAPLFVLALWLKPQPRKFVATAIVTAQVLLFFFVAFRQPFDPAANPQLTVERLKRLQPTKTSSGESPLMLPKSVIPTWQFELDYMTPYAKLNEVLSDYLGRQHTEVIRRYADQAHVLENKALPTLWQQQQDRESVQIEALTKALESSRQDYQEAKARLSRNEVPVDRNALLNAHRIVSHYEVVQGELKLLQQRRQWLDQQEKELSFLVMPLFRPFHWEDDAGGDQALNAVVPWWELTRPDRKDLAAALVFGVRISIVVGISAVALALLIGVPFGCMAGYYAGTVDIVACRLMEIWEAMPTFFMLLLVVSMLQSKSIFLVIAIIGIFGWTGFSRYIRGEFFKQRNLPYVEACRAQGFDDGYIIFKHILPNAIPPVLTLLPFAVMGAISTEAGLSFLGLGEENSCSWGVLMDEGRRAFPGESYLLWPPAILLTALLVAIALVGDALRDAIDPRLHKG